MPTMPVDGAGNSHHIQALQWGHHSPSSHGASTSCLCARASETNMSAQHPFELKWTFWILVSLESRIRGRKCAPFVIEKTDCPCLNWPVLCPFWLWWDRQPGSYLSLFRNLLLQDSRVLHKHNTNGARSRDQSLPGLTITLMLVALTFGNWGSHHVLTWNYPEPCARSLPNGTQDPKSLNTHFKYISCSSLLLSKSFLQASPSLYSLVLHMLFRYQGKYNYFTWPFIHMALTLSRCANILILWIIYMYVYINERECRGKSLIRYQSQLLERDDIVEALFKYFKLRYWNLFNIINLDWK